MKALMKFGVFSSTILTGVMALMPTMASANSLSNVHLSNAPKNSKVKSHSALNSTIDSTHLSNMPNTNSKKTMGSGTRSTVTNFKPTGTQTVPSHVSPNANLHVTSTVSGAEASAKAWIAQHESGGNYQARNGQYIGKFQLSANYLHGDYSPQNQERTADQYVKARYGSWVNAKQHWLNNNWY